MIPFAQPYLGGRCKEYVVEALDNNWLTHRAPPVGRFEEAFGQYVGRQAVACSSGTAALHLALLHAGVGAGDEVIVPDLTFGATAAAVVHVGATPVLVDVGPEWTLRPEEIIRALTSRTRAIIPVHLYGVACEMLDIMKLAREHSLVVIEDCAEALGTKIDGRHVGTFGDYGCFSLQVNKHITTGEGGMVVCDDPDGVRLWGNAGMRFPYWHEVMGLNYRMTALQAALGLGQVEIMFRLMVMREKVVKAYHERLEGRGEWVFLARVPSPPEALSRLHEKGVEARPVFTPLHMQAPLKTTGEFPNSRAAHASYVALPTGPHVDAGNIEYICRQVRTLWTR